MGRPIKEKFFGNLNGPYHSDYAYGLSGTGGTGVSFVLANSGTHYSAGVTASVGAPNLNIDGNPTATVAVAINGTTNGNLVITGSTAGQGYTSTATVTVSTASGVTAITVSGVTGTNTVSTTATVSGVYNGMRAIGTGINAGATYVTGVSTSGSTTTITLSANNASVVSSVSFYDSGAGATIVTTLNAIQHQTLNVNAWAPYKKNSNFTANTTGSAIISDILRQESSRSYRIKNNQGYGRCVLTTTSTGNLTIGQMNLVATDANGSTYFVQKLTAHRASLVQYQSAGGGFLFANDTVGPSVRWTTATTVTTASQTVSIATI